MDENKICPFTRSNDPSQFGSPCLREKCAWWVEMPSKKAWSSVSGEKDGYCAAVLTAKRA